MWEQLARYRNHFLQHEIKDVMKPTSINSLQTTGNLVAIYNQRRIIIKKKWITEWTHHMEKRNICKCMPLCCNSTSTHLADRAELAYGWFALPKLLKELDSDVGLTHWKAVVSLSEFVLNPLNAQRAIIEMDLVRKWVVCIEEFFFLISSSFYPTNRLKNAFMRMRLKHHKEEHREVEMYLRIYSKLKVV